ncbi:hypothetical protein [Alcanivorax sp.]|uniref:hypothetical protein n=1 Tax=Alcanivorax sp. TaxID=1872427 RepID=UPI002B272BDE|nr:hypothetical protein [Alcanivorax sp.]
MMKSIPVVGKIAMLAAILGLFLGMSAFCFFDAGSKVYGVLILLFKIMWGIWFVLYLMAFIIYASRK